MTGHVRNKPEVVMHYDNLIADIQNTEYGCSRTEAITKAMLLGLEYFGEYLESKGRLSQETLDALDAFNRAVDDEIQETRKKHVKRVYEHGDTEKARELAERYRLDFELIVKEYTIPVENSDKSPIIRGWLKSYFKNGESRQVHKVKADILEDGVVSPGDWSLVKSIASTDGYSKGGARGFWQKPEN
jgi:hypothetical protein